MEILDIVDENGNPKGRNGRAEKSARRRYHAQDLACMAKILPKIARRHQFHQLAPCGVRKIYVIGRIINRIKKVINKGFPNFEIFSRSLGMR